MIYRWNPPRWRFPEMWIPQNRWFPMENPIHMDDVEVPLLSHMIVSSYNIHIIPWNYPMKLSHDPKNGAMNRWLSSPSLTADHRWPSFRSSGSQRRSCAMDFCRRLRGMACPTHAATHSEGRFQGRFLFRHLDDFRWKGIFRWKGYMN